MLFGHFWPTYLVLLYNVPFLGLSWTFLPTLIRDVINESSLNSQMLGNFRIFISLMLLLIIVNFAQCCLIFWKYQYKISSSEKASKLRYIVHYYLHVSFQSFNLVQLIRKTNTNPEFLQRIFRLFTFWVFLQGKSFKSISLITIHAKMLITKRFLNRSPCYSSLY